MATEKNYYDVGFVLYDEKNRIVSRLNRSDKKITAYIVFSGLQINFDHIISSAVTSPIGLGRLRQMCWNHIQEMIEKAKGEYKYAAVFTRLEVGSGYNTLRHRMNQIINFVFDHWYSPSVRNDLETNYYADLLYPRINRGAYRQNNYS